MIPRRTWCVGWKPASTQAKVGSSMLVCVTDGIRISPQCMSAAGGLHGEPGGAIWRPLPSQRRQFKTSNIPAFHAKVGRSQKFSWLRMSEASRRKQGRYWTASEPQGEGGPCPSSPHKWQFQTHLFSALYTKVGRVQKLWEERTPCNAHDSWETSNFWEMCVNIFDYDFINGLSKLIVACPHLFIASSRWTNSWEITSVSLSVLVTLEKATS